MADLLKTTTSPRTVLPSDFKNDNIFSYRTSSWDVESNSKNLRPNTIGGIFNGRANYNGVGSNSKNLLPTVDGIGNNRAYYNYDKSLSWGEPAWTITGIAFFGTVSLIMILYLYCSSKKQTKHLYRNGVTEHLVLDQNGRLPICVRPRVHPLSRGRVFFRIGLSFCKTKLPSKLAGSQAPPRFDAESVAPPPYEEAMSMIGCSRSPVEISPPYNDLNSYEKCSQV